MMTYSALYFPERELADLDDVKALIKNSSNMNQWKPGRRQDPMILKNDKAKFYLYLESASAFPSSLLGSIVKALDEAGSSQAKKDCLGKEGKVLKIWFADPDPDMLYFNDFLLLIELIESKYGGVAWNWQKEGTLI